MFKAEKMPGGYRKTLKSEAPDGAVELYSGIIINPEDRNSSDTCTIYVVKGPFWTKAYTYVWSHGNLVASGSGRRFRLPWKSNRIATVTKAFENAGIRFVRDDGRPFEKKESYVMPQIVKEICKMVGVQGDEFIVARRY